MLTCKVGNKIINSIDYNYDEIRRWSNKGILKCPICDGKMIFRKGLIKIPHFAHKDSCTEDKGYWENETKEHYSGKIQLYNWLKQLSNVRNVELEKWISETRQRPDLCFEIENKKFVIEFQCTPITLEIFLERSNLYKLNGIKDIWIFGMENFNPYKMKAIENEYIKNEKISYYLNSFEGTITKVFYNDVVCKRDISKYRQSIVDYNNLFIENNQIYTNKEVEINFYHYLYKIKEQQKYKSWNKINELLSLQQHIYDKTIETINKKREKAEADAKISMLLEKLKDKIDQIKVVNVFFDYSEIKEVFKNKFGKYVSFKAYEAVSKLKKEFILEKLLLADVIDGELYILMPMSRGTWFPYRMEYMDYNYKVNLNYIKKICKVKVINIYNKEDVVKW